MEYRIAYGKRGIAVDLPGGSDVTVIEPRFMPAEQDQYDALVRALRNPIGSPSLAEMCRGARRIGIIVNDITRATPNPLILSAIRAELSSVPDDRIVIFNATGTHRANTREELEAMLGAENARRFRIVQNDARDGASHIAVGTTSSGNEIRILRELLDCDVKVLTGFIEPHFFAGFSGGGKAVMPGLAALTTIMHNHTPKNLDNPLATWGVITGNPIAEEVREAVRLVPSCFLVNVALNREKGITGVFAGNVIQAHDAGCAFVKEVTMVPVERRFDVVITSNSGYPLDLNLYQSVKGMSAAAQVVKPGGAIIEAAECWDGIPDHGEYGRMLRDADSPAALLEMIRSPGFHRQDMWQAQLHAVILEKARVFFHSDHLSAKQIEDAFLSPCPSIAETVARLAAETARPLSICILPEGPLTIPYCTADA
jgi:nickel-dependent lactate racemase